MKKTKRIIIGTYALINLSIVRLVVAVAVIPQYVQESWKTFCTPLKAMVPMVEMEKLDEIFAEFEAIQMKI